MHSQQSEKPTIAFSTENIIKAFQILGNPQNLKETIGSADSYLCECEKNQEFPFCLISIIASNPNLQLKKQVFIMLKNVLKRNWVSRRRTSDICILTQEMKAKIKIDILNLYMQHWKTSVKDLNQIIKYLTRQEYPLKYPQLHKFICNVLSTLSSQDINTFINSEQLLPFLSTVKSIMKEYAMKKILHSKENYEQHIHKIVQISLEVQEKIHESLSIIQNPSNKSQDLVKIKNILECSRKVDKIILYSIQSIVTELQLNPVITKIVLYFIEKIGKILTIYQNWNQVFQIKQQAQLNISAIVELLTKLQGHMPFVFVNFLQNYFTALIKLFLEYNFQNQRLNDILIIGLTKPFTTFCYYKNEEDFSESIYCRKDNAEQYKPLQAQCHKIYVNTFGGQNAGMFLQKIVSVILPRFQRLNEEDEVLFEDSESVTPDNNIEMDTFELIIVLVKHLIMRFKRQCLPVINQIVSCLIENGSEKKYPRKIFMNMGEIILLIPRIYEEEQIPFEKIFVLMEKTFEIRQYDLFVRIIRNYQTHIKSNQIGKCFEILIQIILIPNIRHQTLYQSAVCIRRIISEHQENQIPIQKLGQSIVRIIQLMNIYKDTPNHLWNIINLINQLIRSISTQQAILNAPILLQALKDIMNQSNDELTVCAIVDLLQNLMETVTYEDGIANYQITLQVSMLSFKLIDENIKQQNEQSLTILFILWIKMIREYDASKSPPEINSSLIDLFNKYRPLFMKQQPNLFVELVQQYVLCGLLQLSQDDIISLFTKILSQNVLQHKHRLSLVLFSLYLTYSLLTNTYIQQILLLGVNELKDSLNKVSPTHNSLRTQILLAINFNIINFGPQTIFAIFNKAWPDYRQWYFPYIWSSTYLSHKYAFKVNTIATLNSLHLIQNQILKTPIDGQYPFDIVLKNITIQVQPFKINQALQSYHQTTQKMMYKIQQSDSYRNKRPATYNTLKDYPRKVKLHVNKVWVQADLRGIYKEKIGNMLNSWDWAEDDLTERFGKNIVDKMVLILRGNIEEAH